MPLTGDTIKCNITLVNESNIFYDVKVKKHIKHNYISQLNIKTYTISKENKPEIIGKIDNTNKPITKSDDSRKILFLERTILNAGQTEPFHRIINEGNKVKVVLYSNKI